jgi:hypothetical protein
MFSALLVPIAGPVCWCQCLDDIGNVVVVHLFSFLVEWHLRALHTRVKHVVQDLSDILCHPTDV